MPGGADAPPGLRCLMAGWACSSGKSFSLSSFLSASADISVPNNQPHMKQMADHSPAPLSCLKWGDDGELSAHDIALLVDRLASTEKSRRGFRDHFERRRSRRSGQRSFPAQ